MGLKAPDCVVHNLKSIVMSRQDSKTSKFLIHQYLQETTTKFQFYISHGDLINTFVAYRLHKGY